MNQYYNKYCNTENSRKNSSNFALKKENTLCSLYQVENFLCNIQKALRCFKFYCFFK